MSRVKTQCDHCGQIDDHPKAIFLDASKHHDCLSVAEEQFLRNGAQVKGSGSKASAIIDACKSGTKGDDLLELITSGTLPVAEGLYIEEGN